MSYLGPYSLDGNTIDEVVDQTSPGTYYVGRIDESGNFIYVKIGRDDKDVNDRLHDYVGNDEFTKWAYFKFCYWPTAKAAFEEESRVYHQAPGPKNDIHPARPDGKDYPCPVGGMKCFE